jgi:hypothetical protein
MRLACEGQLILLLGVIELPANMPVLRSVCTRMR